MGKTCKFYPGQVKCECERCSDCLVHPFDYSRRVLLSSERDRLETACTVWLRNKGLEPTPGNIIEALYQNRVLDAHRAREMMEANPPALSDTICRGK